MDAAHLALVAKAVFVCGCVVGTLLARRGVTAASAAPSSVGSLSGGGGLPLDAKGRSMHVGLRAGDVAARVLSVGDAGRGERIASALLENRRTITSSRGFVTHTGTFRGVAVSIIVTGMGAPMMDFAVRESHAMVGGPMAILRLGTCGGLSSAAQPRSIVLATASVSVRRNPDAAAALRHAPVVVASASAAASAAAAAAAAAAASSPTCSLREGLPSLVATPACPYDVSGLAHAHGGLTSLYGDALRASLEQYKGRGYSVLAGIDATGDSFYSCQGRSIPHGWDDRNSGLLATLTSSGVSSLQMESFHLLDLARTSPPAARVYAGAAAIVLFNREGGAGEPVSIKTEDLETLELAGGHAALSALTSFVFPVVFE